MLRFEHVPAATCEHSEERSKTNCRITKVHLLTYWFSHTQKICDSFFFVPKNIISSYNIQNLGFHIDTLIRTLSIMTVLYHQCDTKNTAI